MDAPQVQTITSGRDLLDQAKVLARYLNEQPQGWLSAHRLMKTLRWDTVHELPPDVDGKTRLAPPRTESRNQLKRLYAQQNWTELLEQADLMFSSGVSHFWLDIQWYLHQALAKAGAPWDRWTAVIRQDLAQLLERLPGLENLAWNDGTPFADEVTRNWIAQQVMMREDGAWLAGKPLYRQTTPQMTYWRWSRKHWRWQTVRAWKRRWAGYRPVRASPRHDSACYCGC